MVSRGVSRAESLLSLSGEGIHEKIEELIDEKSRSIMNVITQGQMNQYYSAFQHPYSAVIAPPATSNYGGVKPATTSGGYGEDRPLQYHLS